MITSNVIIHNIICSQVINLIFGSLHGAINETMNISKKACSSQCKLLSIKKIYYYEKVII